MNEPHKKGQGHIGLKKKVRNNLKCRLWYTIPYVFRIYDEEEYYTFLLLLRALCNTAEY